MLGQEKLVQQTIHLQQTIAIQLNDVAVDRRKSPVGQSLQRFGEPLFGIDAEFIFELVQADTAEF